MGVDWWLWQKLLIGRRAVNAVFEMGDGAIQWDWLCRQLAAQVEGNRERERRAKRNEMKKTKMHLFDT